MADKPVDTIQPANAKQLKRAAGNHIYAMRILNDAINRVALTTANLIGAMGQAQMMPFEDGSLADKAEKALGELGEAYTRIACLFDDHYGV